MPGTALPLRLSSLRRVAQATLGLAIVALAAAPACAVTVEQIPSPRPAGWTVDLTGALTPETIAALNRLGDEVKTQTGGEMAVVVVGTIDGADPRAFATRLFNAWGIGDRNADNGLLVFAALDDRAAEIVLGDGIDLPETRQASEAIMQGEMVPRFRAGDAAGAIHHGAFAAARRILHATPSGEPAAAEASAPLEAPAPATHGLGAGIWALLAVLGSLSIVAFFKVVPPRCRDCRTRMVKLSESGDDLHLEPSEQIEEKIGSVNYDIWLCNECGKIVKRGWSWLFSGYGRCPGCRARTKSQVSTTLREATERDTGLVQVTEACCNCEYRTTYTRTLPQVQSHVSSRHHGSSSFSSSSSSRSSGGSGFGGGRSSGGGASGRW